MQSVPASCAPASYAPASYAPASSAAGPYVPAMEEDGTLRPEDLEAIVDKVVAKLGEVTRVNAAPLSDAP